MSAGRPMAATPLRLTPAVPGVDPFDASSLNASRAGGAPLWIDWYATALRALEADGRFDERTCREAAGAYADRMGTIFGAAAPGGDDGLGG